VRGLWLAVRFLRLALCAPLLAGLVFATSAYAQAFFYNEVTKDGRLYVFASATRYEAFTRSNGADTGSVIERRGYGPNGETVVFDSQDAINLYNFSTDFQASPSQNLMRRRRPTTRLASSAG